MNHENINNTPHSTDSKHSALNTLTTVIFYLAILFFIIGFNFSHNPAGNWYQQFMPNLDGRNITDITFIDSLNGFAVASRNVNPDTSSILRTTDGGDTWQIVLTQAPRRFSRVKFINSITGFISGGSGSGTPYLYKSTDAGSNWNIIAGATLGTSFWNDMAVLNNDTMWLVDANSLNGGVFFTSNGGANWQQQFSGGNQNPNKIYMYNGRIGFMSNNSASPNIYKTTNSGVNWNLNVNGQWYFDIKFADSLTGWYSAASNIYKTTNSGDNWVLQNVPSGPDLLNLGINKLSILNYDTLWAAGNAVFFPNSQVRAILLRTTNGGSNWQYQIPDTAINNFLYYHLQFIGRNHGWAYTTIRGIHTTTGGDPVWITDIEQISTEIPREFILFQNYPNPFNPKTIIRYQIMKNNSEVLLSVYEITGKHMIDLVSQNQNAGTYETDFSGNSYSSGVYFYKITVSNGKEVFTETKKMMLIK